MRKSPTPGLGKISRAAIGIYLLLFCLPVCGEPLQLRIEHTEVMPSVSPELRPGAKFNLNLTEESPSNVWIKIPPWLAGTWLIDSETTVFRQDCCTGSTTNTPTYFNAKSRFTYGKQRDREGGIWHYLGVPYSSTTDFPTFIEYHKVSAKECVAKSSHSISLKTQFDVARVSKGTHRVIETLQQESITTYNFVSIDELGLKSSTKVFDDLGAAKNIVANQAVVTRAEPFVQSDFENGKDLHELFRQFLLAKNLKKLLPD